MTDQLRSCPECQRHVFERDAVCPFCKAKTTPVLRAVATVAAVALSMASAVATGACGDKPVPAVPDGVPSADAGAVPDPAASTPPTPTVPRGDKGPAPVYGGPPP